jgi:hypothetical protein
MKLARCRRPKVAYFPSYVEYRPNANTKIYENQVMLTEVTYERGGVKEKS